MHKILPILTFIVCVNICFAQTITVQHTYYTCQFDTVFKQGILNDYWQTAEHQITAKNKVDRKTVASFYQDNLIPKEYQLATKKGYQAWNKANQQNKYDVGHIVPFEAMAFDVNAAKATMLFNTNTAPQSSYFNEHEWALTEKVVLDSLGALYDSIHVITGVLINDDSKKMGDVYVPDYYFKIAEFNGQQMCWLGLNDVTNRDTNHSDIVISKKLLLSIIKSYYPKLNIYGTETKSREAEGTGSDY